MAWGRASRDGAPASLTTAAEVRAQAVAYLARREHSTRELRTKLVRRCPSADMVDDVLAELVAIDLLSDERTAHGVARVKGARMGAMGVERELRARGIEGELASSVLADLRTTEVARAQEIWSRKFGEPAIDAAGRARQMRFLQSRGFGSDAIRAVVPPCPRPASRR
jgi:regulatory protein